MRRNTQERQQWLPLQRSSTSCGVCGQQWAAAAVAADGVLLALWLRQGVLLVAGAAAGRWCCGKYVTGFAGCVYVACLWCCGLDLSAAMLLTAGPCVRVFLQLRTLVGATAHPADAGQHQLLASNIWQGKSEQYMNAFLQPSHGVKSWQLADWRYN